MYLSKFSNVFVKVALVVAVAGQVFSGRPPQRPVLWPAHCSQKTPHVDFLFDSSLSRLQWLYLRKGTSNSSRKEASPRQAREDYCSVFYQLYKMAILHILFIVYKCSFKEKQKKKQYFWIFGSDQSLAEFFDSL